MCIDERHGGQQLLCWCLEGLSLCGTIWVLDSKMGRWFGAFKPFWFSFLKNHASCLLYCCLWTLMVWEINSIQWWELVCQPWTPTSSVALAVWRWHFFVTPQAAQYLFRGLCPTLRQKEGRSSDYRYPWGCWITVPTLVSLVAKYHELSPLGRLSINQSFFIRGWHSRLAMYVGHPVSRPSCWHVCWMHGAGQVILKSLLKKWMGNSRLTSRLTSHFGRF